MKLVFCMLFLMLSQMAAADCSPGILTKIIAQVDSSVSSRCSVPSDLDKILFSLRIAKAPILGPITNDCQRQLDDAQREIENAKNSAGSENCVSDLQQAKVILSSH